MATINFFCEDIEFKISHPRKASSWLKKVAQSEKAVLEQINFIFCSDRYLKKMNINFLKHSTLTDVITFEYSESPKIIQGDIFISINRVRENAVEYSKSFDDELDRVMVHGLLHLLGYHDKTVKQKAFIRKKEDRFLSLR